MKVTFSATHSVFAVKAPKDTLVSLSATPTQVEDGVYKIGDSGVVLVDEQHQTDSIYLSTAGQDYTVARGERIATVAEGVEVWAGSSGISCPFAKGGEGGGGSVTLDDHVTQNSPNPVKSSGIYEALSNKQDIIQYTTMPTITSAMVGQIAMYVGATDANYTQGYFYIAASDGQTEPTYSWVNLPVSPRTYSEAVLWTNPNPTVSNPSTITLSSAYTNFDEIIIVEKHIADNKVYTSTAKYLVSAMALNDMLGIALGDGGLFTWYKLTAADELTEQISGLILHSIIGIKY